MVALGGRRLEVAEARDDGQAVKLVSESCMKSGSEGVTAWEKEGRPRALFLWRDGGGGNLSRVRAHTQGDSGECAYGWDAGTLGHWLESLIPNFPGSVGNRMRVKPL